MPVSATPLTRKLGIKPEARLGLFRAPEGFDAVLGALPPGVTVRRRAQGSFDVIVGFCTRGAELERRLPAWREALDEAGGLWIAWPKRSSGVASDLGDGPVREAGLAAGLVDNKVCAIDETWSGLRFVYRLADRTGGRWTGGWGRLPAGATCTLRPRCAAIPGAWSTAQVSLPIAQHSSPRAYGKRPNRTRLPKPQGMSAAVTAANAPPSSPRAPPGGTFADAQAPPGTPRAAFDSRR